MDEGDGSVLFDPESGGTPKVFPMDGAFPPSASQADVWASVGEPIVEGLLCGYNSTVLAYGATGSGKTHTILGPTTARASDSWSFADLDAEAAAAATKSASGGGWNSRPFVSSLGLLPRAVHAILGQVAEAHAQAAEEGLPRSPRDFRLAFACAEVYRNSLLDLCGASASTVAEGDAGAAAPGSGGGAVIGSSNRVGSQSLGTLTWMPIPLTEVLPPASADGGGGEDGGLSARGSCATVGASPSASLLHSLLAKANALRVTAATAGNRDSSRSHVLYLLRVSCVDQDDGVRKEGTLSVVDLAGSETLDTSITGSAGAARGAETRAINSSLHTLKRVVEAYACAPPGSTPPHVPWRESLLTTLLRDSIGGNCRTSILVNLSGDNVEAVAHSLRACNFGKLARSVRNTARVNTAAPLPPPDSEGGDSQAARIAELESQLAELSGRLRDAEGRLVVALSAKRAQERAEVEEEATAAAPVDEVLEVPGTEAAVQTEEEEAAAVEAPPAPVAPPGPDSVTLTQLASLVSDPDFDPSSAGRAVNDWLALSTEEQDDGGFEGTLRRLAGVACGIRGVVLDCGLEVPQLAAWGPKAEAQSEADAAGGAFPEVDESASYERRKQHFDALHYSQQQVDFHAASAMGEDLDAPATARSVAEDAAHATEPVETAESCTSVSPTRERLVRPLPPSPLVHGHAATGGHRCTCGSGGGGKLCRCVTVPAMRLLLEAVLRQLAVLSAHTSTGSASAGSSDIDATISAMQARASTLQALLDSATAEDARVDTGSADASGVVPGPRHLPLPTSSVHHWEYHDAPSGEWARYGAATSEAITAALNATLLGMPAAGAAASVSSAAASGGSMLVVLGGEQPTDTDGTALAPTGPRLATRGSAPVPPTTASLDACAQRVLGPAAGIDSLGLPCGTDALPPYATGSIIDPLACTEACLRTGSARRVRRVTHAILEGSLQKLSSGILTDGSWITRTLRLTPTGIHQLAPGSGSGVKRTLVSFETVSCRADAPPASAPGPGAETQGRLILVRCAHRRPIPGQKPLKAPVMRLLASSRHDAELWAAQITAASHQWAAEAAAAAGTEDVAFSDDGTEQPLPPSGHGKPVPLSAHPEAQLAAALMVTARAASGAEYRARAAQLSSDPEEVVAWAARAESAGPSDLTDLLYTVPRALSVLRPAGWVWAPGQGEGPSGITSVVPLLLGSPTYEARVIPVTEAVASCEALRRLAVLNVADPAQPGAGVHSEVLRAARLQNHCLAALFAATVEAASRGAAGSNGIGFDVGYLPVTCAAQARRLAAYGLSVDSDVPRLACTPLAAVEACVAAVSSASDAAASVRRAVAASFDGVDDTVPDCWDATAATTVCLAVVRVAYRRPGRLSTASVASTPSIRAYRAALRSAVGRAMQAETPRNSLQAAMVQLGGAAEAVIAAHVELLVWVRAKA